MDQNIVTACYTAIEIMKDISPLFSALAILIAWLTLREIKQQRQESYKPRLMFQNKNFFLQKNSNGIPNILKENKKEGNDLYAPEYKIALKNIGLGAAHDIKIQWKYKHSELIKLFKEYADKSELLRVNKNNHFEYLFENNDSEGYGFFINPFEKEEIQLASLSSGESVNVQLPKTIRNYLSFIPYLELIKAGNPRRVDLLLKDFLVEFKFFDIGGKRQCQKLQVNIELHAYSKEFQQGNYGIGSIKFYI